MKKVLLIQLPIPCLNFGMKTGNIPLAAAYLKQAADPIQDVQINIFPESLSSYIGDSAIIRMIIDMQPDIIGFTIYNWNIERSLYIARKIKDKKSIKVVFGGPEITPDNTLADSEYVDFLVYGEGEAVFRRLLVERDFWEIKKTSESAEAIFRSCKSPYLNNLLEPDINKMMYLESQRGCPFQCGFCYYNKSRKKISFADERLLFEAIQWAHNLNKTDHQIEDLCFLDPSLNIRPDLKGFLKNISDINNDKQLSLNGEIRVDKIDEETADLFFEAGFTSFEIGLQSTNPSALKIMNRPTDLDAFLKGVNLLKERDILPRLDLIVGLPGDDIEGFKQSISFVAEYNLFDDMMVFPLSILPGSDFKKNFSKLGITYEPMPPYTVTGTSTFSKEDIFLTFDYAETLFDMSLFPPPFLDVSLYGETNINQSPDHVVRLKDEFFISKIILDSKRSFGSIEHAAQNLTQPYQVIIHPGIKDSAFISKALSLLTSANPFSPLEIIFLEPENLPDTNELLAAIQLKRPAYLDNDLLYLYSKPGNRSVLFTVISKNSQSVFSGEMKRQVYWWKHSQLPEMKDLEELNYLDGILIDLPNSSSDLIKWQDRFSGLAEDIPYISFADTTLQKRWLLLTASNEYASLYLSMEP